MNPVIRDLWTLFEAFAFTAYGSCDLAGYFCWIRVPDPIHENILHL